MSRLWSALGAALIVTTLGACATLGGGKNKEPDMFVGLVLDPEGTAIPFAKISVVAETASEDAKPSNDQISCIHTLITQGANLYVDFALWGAHNKRFQERMKCEHHRYDPAQGTWKMSELPGPHTHDDWVASWNMCHQGQLPGFP